MIQDPYLTLYADLRKRDGSISPSEDAYGHALTVTNATWGLQGRTFDGTGDYIEGVNNSALNFTTGDFSILVWANVTNTTGGRYLFARGLINTDGYLLVAGGTDALYFYSNQAAANQAKKSVNSQLLLGSFYMYSATVQNLAVKLYRNNIEITESVGTVTAPATCTRTFKIGTNDAKTGAFMLGIMGEVMVFSRCLSPLEIQNIYLMTKWSYA